ncbi:hypothetical protein SADUNF_Sadunf02G0121400 [Salix dunnii]|uniref:Uncharacterized protein n=1 Tax=Salix dunnii TaxID=1413687 RepID=A0A835N7A7_9ROSI|nr:hypothetical protein SADUNF_Sadunf02G0121400 [Salix dunnii]
MTTKSSSSVFVTPSSLPISLVGLTNNFSTHLNANQLVVESIKNTLSSTACLEVLGKNVAKDVWDT